jgi:hypothetical protein
MQPGEGRDERLLGHVEGRIVVTETLTRQGIRDPTVAVGQLVEGTAVALPAQGHEVGIGSARLCDTATQEP